MRDPVLSNCVEDRRWINTAHANMSAGDRSHGPGICPPVAMKHRKGPQIDRIPIETESDCVAERIQKSPTVVIDNTLRMACGTRGVVECDWLPFVDRLGPRGCRI